MWRLCGVSAPEQFDSVIKTYSAVTNFYVAVRTSGVSTYDKCVSDVRGAAGGLTDCCVHSKQSHVLLTLCHTTLRDSRLLAC